MGNEAIRLLRFAIRYPQGWHSVTRGQPRVRRALATLEGHGLIELRRHKAPAQWQFRITQPA